MRCALFILGVAALGWAPPAAADPPAQIPCSCRANGASHPVGAVVCIRNPAGARLARCGRVLSNTSWTFLDAPCPTAGLAPPPSPEPEIRAASIVLAEAADPALRTPMWSAPAPRETSRP